MNAQPDITSLGGTTPPSTNLGLIDSTTESRPLTNTELDELCVQTQYALTVLVRDLIRLYRSGDIHVKEKCAQLMALNCCMRSIQDYDTAHWTDLDDADINDIKQRIIYLSEWRN